MTTENRKIEGAVVQFGRIYKAGDEAALALVLPQSDIDRLAAKGVLTGDWSSAPGESSEPAETDSAVDESSAQPAAPAEAVADEPETASELPEEPEPSVALESSDAPASAAKKSTSKRGMKS